MSRWPQLGLLLEAGGRVPTVQIWLFGSALRVANPKDLDVLLVYEDRSSVETLRDMQSWDEFSPPCHIIAMTPDEVAEYDFISATGAIRVL